MHNYSMQLTSVGFVSISAKISYQAVLMTAA